MRRYVSLGLALLVLCLFSGVAIAPEFNAVEDPHAVALESSMVAQAQTDTVTVTYLGWIRKKYGYVYQHSRPRSRSRKYQESNFIVNITKLLSD